ncbi:hypothetical protein [Mycolicibacterium sp. lyk4-40-TYG-92]|uniref:hypothetical protein n=1 Tax=Mycolicibacterium sp. lyk4-40-TYG-92 TaxID=3040295 RepID=UPI00254C743F|nr:hypothetical protein [Mycolicibacterium sp. lyk4-40-TYG-92]
MIVNSFILCSSATFTAASTVNITDAGIRDVHIQVADDWQPGQQFGFEIGAVLFAENQSTDTSQQPYLTVHLRAGKPENGSTAQVLLSGWQDGNAGTKFIHEAFPLQFVLREEGDYMLTVHPEGMDNDTAAAVYPLKISVIKA